MGTHDDRTADARRMPFVAAMAVGAVALGADLATSWADLPAPVGAASLLVVVALAAASLGVLRGHVPLVLGERLGWSAGLAQVTLELTERLVGLQPSDAESVGMRVLVWHAVMSMVTHLVFGVRTARRIVVGLTVGAYVGFGAAVSAHPDPTSVLDGAMLPLFVLAVAEGTVLRARSLAADAARAEAEASLGRTDQLTGLPNRRGLLPLLGATRDGDAVLLVDVDHFKQVNDVHGHDVGDAVLRRIAGLLRTGARADDTVGRWGGEEFLVVTGRREGGPRPSAGDVRRLGERLCAAVRDDVGEPTATVSVGVGVLRADEGWEDALRRADACLYAAKSAGRDRVVADRDEPTTTTSH